MLHAIPGMVHKFKIVITEVNDSMIKLKFLNTFLFISFFFFTQNLFSQFNIYSDYQLIFDDNIYNNYLNTPDHINVLSFGGAYNFESEVNNVQIYYEGVLGDYTTNKFKSFNTNSFGVVNTSLFGEEYNPLNIGFYYTFRNNRDDFTIFNFQQLSAYANYRHSIKETNFLISGYIFYRNEYPNFNVFSNYEHKGFVKWISNFESLTSVMISTEFNYKKYFDQYNIDGYANDGAFLKLHLNIGQSLGENTGANLFASFRKNLSEKSRYVISDSLIFYEEEIFNDLYAFNSFEVGVGLTKIIGDNFKLSSEIKYSPKYFTSLYAADIFGNDLESLREDKQISVGIGMEYQLTKILEGLSISATFNFIKNNSNDYYYDYSNKIYSVSIGYGF